MGTSGAFGIIGTQTFCGTRMTHGSSRSQRLAHQVSRGRPVTKKFLSQAETNPGAPPSLVFMAKAMVTAPPTSPAHKQPPWLRGRKGSSPNGKGWFAPDTLRDEQPEERSELPVAPTALLAHVHHKDREAALSSWLGWGAGEHGIAWLAAPPSGACDVGAGLNEDAASSDSQAPERTARLETGRGPAPGGAGPVRSC